MMMIMITVMAIIMKLMMIMMTDDSKHLYANLLVDIGSTKIHKFGQKYFIIL